MEGRQGIPAAWKAIVIGLTFHIGSTVRLVIARRERESLKWDSRRELVQGFSITTSIETREMQPSWGAWSRIRCKEAHRTDEIAWERISVHADLQHAVVYMPDQ